uniref:pyruvate kinase n=1 Tax=Spodoptera frugiperda TaxID=7108 RepID=A0A2H1V6E8_SPOFR
MTEKTFIWKCRDLCTLYENAVMSEDAKKQFYKTTPLIITFGSAVLSEFDINSFIELGQRIMRFKMNALTEREKFKLLSLLDKALQWCCVKYNISTWPLALAADIPNSIIKTGFIENKSENPNGVTLEKNSIVEVTCENTYENQCNAKRIFIDDSYIVADILPNTEITINFGDIKMKCIENINEKNIRCKVTSEGQLIDQSFFCVRGVIHRKPCLNDTDLEIIKFAKKLKFDIITLNLVRNASTVKQVRKLTAKQKPLLISAICEQEGLDNIDSIIKFGKPLYLSGDILQNTLDTGEMTSMDINNITNAILHKSGFVLRSFKNPDTLTVALRTLHDICSVVEPLSRINDNFMSICQQHKQPVTAALAATQGAILLAKLTHSLVIVVPTVSGRTVKQLTSISVDKIIIAITSSPMVAKQLQLYKGVLAILYDTDPEMPSVDIEKAIEMGMNVARLKTSHFTMHDKAKMLNNIEKASSFLAKKHGLLQFPCATCIELKTCVVQTGLLEEELAELWIEENSEVFLTNRITHYDKCNESQIFVDDPFLVSDVKIGMEINISQEEIIMVCVSKGEHSVKCTVTKGGYLRNMAYVCMRGAVRKRPYLSKKDAQLIKFAIEYQADMIIINYPRHAATINKIKKYLGTKVRRPILIAGISTQEGLMNIDDFVKEADGILLSREFLAYEVETALYNRMGAIQKLIAGKCRQAGKPFYVSGGIFEEALTSGIITTRDISDVTNAILEGASGVCLSETPNSYNLCETINMLNELCASVEPLCMDKTDFCDLVSQIKMPVNAAEACAISCATVANQTNARLIIVPTVSGRTAYLLNWMRPNSTVIAVSTKMTTIKLLKTFRSVVPLYYKGGSKKTWFQTVQARIVFALEYAVEQHWILYGDHYITLEKMTEGSSFCDTVRVWNVTLSKKNSIECPESYHDFNINTYKKKKHKPRSERKKVKVTEVKKTEEDSEVKSEKMETTEDQEKGESEEVKTEAKDEEGEDKEKQDGDKSETVKGDKSEINNNEGDQ